VGTPSPGPWEYRPPGHVEVFGPGVYVIGAHDTEPLAAVDQYTYEAEGTARLVAAAPDLLAALEDIVAGVDPYVAAGVVPAGANADPLYQRALAAIAKARGSDIVAP